jgi:diguanylate cyclase (GGDEF)-like protein
MSPELVQTVNGRMDIDRLGYYLADRALPLDLVSAYAGDRMISEAERAHIEELKKTRGDEFFSDLLYTLSHEYFPSSIGESLWNDILRHKLEMSDVMKRNVRIAVAALDYLSNLKGTLNSATLIEEKHASDIARLALHDGLTRLFNHTSCLQKIEQEMAQFEHCGRILSLMMVDIDDFKKINDLYGHHAGDEVLAALGSILQSSTRTTDICCRYGGEEFAILLPSTALADAVNLAERLRIQIQAGLPGLRPITVSIGVACCGPDIRTAKALVEKADEALYQAKRLGKNRVMSA